MVSGGKKATAAVAYLRTSSAANVGGDKDSEHRQRATIEAFAKREGFEILHEFYDRACHAAKTPSRGGPASRPCWAAL
jgi:hypothetical protein